MRRQPRSIASIEELYCEADEANRLLQHVFESIARRVGAVEHRPAPVKDEDRALQKANRTYGGDWRRLCDLSRTSLIFDDAATLARGLRTIADDQRVQVLKADEAKQRLRETFDADRLSGGYRDVQLSVRLIGPEAERRRLWRKAAGEGHVMEVQLHLRAIFECKSGGGHKAYVEARNLRGD